MFDESQMGNLRALFDTLIPPDEYPGAWDAGVGDYLLRQLAGDLAELLPAYQRWLASLDEEALADTGLHFSDLSLADRSALLSRIESGEVHTDWSIEPASFFRQIVEHCGEGYYSDPGNGGNCGGVAWKMIGFEVRG